MLFVKCSTNATLVDTYGILQTPVEGVADKGVTDRYLVDPRYALDEILQILGV